IPVLAELKGPNAARAVEALRPRAEDFAHVFSDAVAEGMEAAYQEIWRDPPRVGALAADTLLKVDGCPAGMLGGNNELSAHFPGGYRALAPYLRPNRIWFVWRYVTQGHTSGVRFDGLVRLEERWAWFPKPYRVLGELLRSVRH